MTTITSVGASIRVTILRGRVACLAVALLGGAGCSFENSELPSTVRDPAITRTAAGALEAYRGTLALFQFGFGSDRQESFVPTVGVLTDELRQGTDWGGVGGVPGFSGSDHLSRLDRRSLPLEYDQGLFGNLQKIRGQGGQAIALLAHYVPEQPALAGHLYDLVGYSEVFLAELFCSGIPLSTLDFDGDYTLQPGVTTAEVFQHAVALFDTARTLAMTEDSTRFVHLAEVGIGRAWLGLGNYAAAAAAVAGVPDTFRYEVRYAAVVAADTLLHAKNFVVNDRDLNIGGWTLSVADQDGGKGLDYISSGDPRTRAMLLGINPYGNPVYAPAMYAVDGSSPIVLASGVEARLIEAEAALLQNPDDGTWLAKLNALRTDGVSEERPTDDPNDDPAATYTFWHAGSGGVDSLAPLTDPGSSQNARVDLLFRERAFWLFLTGHRQGDLRRLLRPPYGRSQVAIYPGGFYPGGLVYGGDVTLPIPPQEQITNPRFTGCISRGA